MENPSMGDLLPVEEMNSGEPKLIQIGKRQFISTGRWNDEKIYEYLVVNGKSAWVTVAKLGEVAWGQKNIANTKRARRYLTDLWRFGLTEKGILLSIEYSAEWPRRALAVKIYDPNDDDERAQLIKKIDRLLKRGEMSVERYEGAKHIIDSGNKYESVADEAAA